MAASDMEAVYSTGHILPTILNGLVAAGKDPDHIGPDDDVPDAGCAIGGPARHLARAYGCRVTGVDFTPEFVEVGNELTRRAGLALFDVGGPTQPLHFPVPWAEDPAWNVLEPADTIRALVEEAGFGVTLWENLTEQAIPLFATAAVAMAAPPGPLGLHLLVNDLPTKFGNLARNFEEDRARVIRRVAVAG